MVSFPTVPVRKAKWIVALASAAGLFVIPAFSACSAHAQTTLLTQNFDNTAESYTDYYTYNLSSNARSGYEGWYVDSTSLPFAAQSGSSYLYSNFEAIADNSTGTISTWFLTPTLTYRNGDTISFYTRTTGNTPVYPDRMQVRFSSAGSSVNVGTSATDVGDFTTQLLEINPLQTTTGYPSAWTRYSTTISGLSTDTAGRIAFRYFVTGGGPNGSASDLIGLDTLSFIRPADTPEPASVALMTLGLSSAGGFAACRRRRLGFARTLPRHAFEQGK